jgi:hypothetical protein
MLQKWRKDYTKMDNNYSKAQQTVGFQCLLKDASNVTSHAH